MQPILKIDLSTGNIDQIEINSTQIENYLGGASLAARLLYDDLDIGVLLGQHAVNAPSNGPGPVLAETDDRNQRTGAIELNFCGCIHGTSPYSRCFVDSG